MSQLRQVIGRTVVDGDWIHTPINDIPLVGSQWRGVDEWSTFQKCPPWAIVLAIVGIVLGVILSFCTIGISLLLCLSALFFIVKNDVTRGTYRYSVVNGAAEFSEVLNIRTRAEADQLTYTINVIKSAAQQ